MQSRSAGSVVCFGELLLRLNAPGREMLFQSPRLDVYVGGAEANVAVSLALLGQSASVVSVVPDSALGAHCIGELRRFGVRTDHVYSAPGRLGIYYMTTGAGHRPSEIVYDRAGSAFAVHAGDLIDWNRALAGSKWLHLSGITPALGANCAQTAVRAARKARELGISVSFDCNYRAKLWETWLGDAAHFLRALAEQSTLLFADERAIALMLGLTLPDLAPEERFRHAAARAFEAFPNLQRLTTMVRTEHSVDHHELCAHQVTRQGATTTRSYTADPIVDRIGTGDAFAAGILFGTLTALADQATLDFALAAAVLKHAIPGDFNRARLDQIHELVAGRGFAVRR